MGRRWPCGPCRSPGPGAVWQRGAGSFDTQPGDLWALNTLDFTLAGLGALTFRNTQRSCALATDGTAFIDGVVRSARRPQVPKPASLGLVGLALAATLVAGTTAGRRLLGGH